MGIAVFACLMAAGLWFIIGQRGPSKLPDFDSAEFIFNKAGTSGSIRWGGDQAAAIGALFEGQRRDLDPMKWLYEGDLTLFQAGKPVMRIEVFANPQGGAGPFKIGDNYYLGYDQVALQRALPP